MRIITFSCAVCHDETRTGRPLLTTASVTHCALSIDIHWTVIRFLRPWQQWQQFDFCCLLCVWWMCSKLPFFASSTPVTAVFAGHVGPPRRCVVLLFCTHDRSQRRWPTFGLHLHWPWRRPLTASKSTYWVETTGLWVSQRQK